MMIPTGIIGDANALLAELGALVKGGISLGVLVIIAVVAISTRFAVAKTLVTAIIGGVVIWLVAFGGLEWIAQGIDGETNGQAATTSITQPW